MLEYSQTEQLNGSTPQDGKWWIVSPFTQANSRDRVPLSTGSGCCGALYSAAEGQVVRCGVVAYRRITCPLHGAHVGPYTSTEGYQ